MNFPQDSSDLSSAGQEAELENQLSDRLFKNYKQIKESIKRQQYQKSSSKKSMGSVQRAIQIQEQKNLETRINLTEKQLSKARQNNILLLKKLGEAEEQAQFLKFQFDKLKREKQDEATSYCSFIQSLKQQLMLVKQQKNESFRASQSKDLMVLKNTLQARQREISKLNLKVKSLQFSLHERQSNMKASALKLQQMNQKLIELQTKSEQVVFDEHSHGSQILQLQQYKNAVERLLSILRNTQQYRQFYNYSENHEEVFFLQTIAKKLRNGTFNINPQRRVACKCKHIKVDERIIWSPASCYKALLQIKQKYDCLNEPCIQEILFELNRLWLAKEEQIASKIRQQCQGQVQKLKKKNFQRYDQLVARKQIERLKKQLQENRFTKKNPQQELAILKNIGEYEDQLRLKQKEIKLLSQRIKIMEAQNINYDRVLYLEGALWLIDKVLDEVNFYQQEIRINQQNLQNKYQINQSDVQSVKMLNSCCQSFRQLTNGLVERLLLMKQTTLKKVGHQKKQFPQNQ